MAFDPMALLQAKKRLELFKEDHPKVFPYFQMLSKRGITEGTIYEIKCTTPEGDEYVCNFRLNANDIESLRILAGMRD